MAGSLETADLFLMNTIFFLRRSGPCMLWLGLAGRHTPRRRSATCQMRDKEMFFCWGRRQTLETDMRCLWKLTTSALWSEGAGDQCLPATWRAEPSSSHPLISSASIQVAGSFKEVKEALIWFRFTVVGKTQLLFLFFSECEPELLNLPGSAKSPAFCLRFSVWRCLVFLQRI